MKDIVYSKMNILSFLAHVVPKQYAVTFSLTMTYNTVHNDHLCETPKCTKKI